MTGYKSYRGFLGDIDSSDRTTEAFWACECDYNFIHTKGQVKCNTCGYRHDEMPDAGVLTIIDMIMDGDIMVINQVIDVLLNYRQPKDTKGAGSIPQRST